MPIIPVDASSLAEALVEQFASSVTAMGEEPATHASAPRQLASGEDTLRSGAPTGGRLGARWRSLW